MAETKFGKRIRSIRQNAECSQKEFCTVLDIPQSTLSAYETDRMQPTVSTLINIATKFNVSLDWLCGIDKTNGGKYIDSKSIGLRIRTLRLERNLTQTDFAKMISKSLRTVQKYENGEIEINISTANDIARILDVSASYILGNDDTVLSSQLPKFPQTFYEKLIYLIEDKGITKNKLLTDLKLNRNSFGNWQKQGSKPRAETMERIAEYFEVTPESLTKDNTEIQYLPTAKKLIAQPAPPTVKLNGTNFTAEIPAYVGADIDVSVVHAENAPAVVEKPDLNVYMNELLEGIENADADTREKFMNEFLKAAKKKKKSMKKHETALSVETVHACLSGLVFVVILLFGSFYPTIIELTIGPIPETGAVSEIFELANFLRPVALLTGALGIALSTFRLIRKILFPS